MRRFVVTFMCQGIATPVLTNAKNADAAVNIAKEYVSRHHTLYCVEDLGSKTEQIYSPWRNVSIPVKFHDPTNVKYR